MVRWHHPISYIVLALAVVATAPAWGAVEKAQRVKEPAQQVERPVLKIGPQIKEQPAVKQDTQKGSSPDKPPGPEGTDTGPTAWEIFKELLQADGVSILGAVFMLVAVVGGFMAVRTGVFAAVREKRRTVADQRRAEPKSDDGTAGRLAASSFTATTGDIMVTDQALDRPEQDLLGTGELALGLARFFQNENTRPPVTLAVTGNWGSGKSSVMGMLKEFLERARFHTVWFNAWHNHGEENLFGALIEAIRQQALPPVWRASGLIFRARLLWIRLRRNPLPVLVLLASIAAWLAGGWGWEGIVDISGNPLVEMQKSALAIVALLAIGANLKLSYAKIGLDLGKEIRRVQQRLRPIDLDVDPGLRFRVKQSLGDICEAMGRHSLVIFIDDLDRCPANQVLRVLETVNFLSTTPRRGFIVLGMDLDKVLPAISSEFATMVEEKADEFEEKEDSEVRRKRLKAERREYARQYLRKLVNIEVHVPIASADKLKQLVRGRIDREAREENSDGSRARNPMRATLEERRNRLIRVADQRVFPALLAGVVLFAVATSAFSYLHGEDGPRGDAGSPTVPVVKPEIVPDAWLYVSGGFGLLGILGFLLIPAAEVLSRVQDREVFVKAVRIWTPAFRMENITPRHNKRVVNELRLMAMRARLDPKGQEGSADGSDDDTARVVSFVMLRGLQALGVKRQALLTALDEACNGEVQNPPQWCPIAQKLKDPGIWATLSDDPKGRPDRVKCLLEVLERHMKKLGIYLPVLKGHACLYDDLNEGVLLTEGEDEPFPEYQAEEDNAKKLLRDSIDEVQAR